jgi:NDP-sugar pyrophosphorylase family protein
MNEPKRTAVILAGGLGSRLHPYTFTIPKPLLPLNGVSIIEIVIRQLKNHRFSRIVVTLGYMGDFLKFVLGDGSKFGLSIEYVTEETPLGTAGSLFLVDDLPSCFLVMNGDLLTTANYSQFLEQTMERNAAAAVMLSERTVNVDYGVIETDANSVLVAYHEKPKMTYQVSTGIYALSNRALKHVTGKHLDMPDLIGKLRSEPGGVYAPVEKCYWQDIGRIEDFEKAGKDFTQEPSLFLE